MPNRNPVCSGNSDSQRAGVDTTIATICFCSLGTGSIQNLGEGLTASFKWSLENLPPPHTISLSCITRMCLLLVRHLTRQGRVGERLFSLGCTDGKARLCLGVSRPRSLLRAVDEMETERKLGPFVGTYIPLLKTKFRDRTDTFPST